MRVKTRLQKTLSESERHQLEPPAKKNGTSGLYKKKQAFKYRFDFEIGYLVKSPCKECEVRKQFPKCVDDCSMLDKIHTRLSEAVSCTRNS